MIKSIKNNGLRFYSLQPTQGHAADARGNRRWEDGHPPGARLREDILPAAKHSKTAEGTLQPAGAVTARRRIAPPTRPKPAIIINHVAGSGILDVK